ncbi:redoxin domain-containing protein [Sphingobacterium sp. DK4209]|uniref:Redoxin domain-containing protein n=1 Tax=Sphingobacterium zhuxiongii TaxID=2662364 RepID=A0A5Q0Q7G6_9SPHI|nr:MULTISPECIES: TlpA disulfide reductase family protein [unclassified Sphingobacterium]MVZ67312.1 redoxin domain-containing protein [Sphingobacterium sp. DK4209]QGA25049.1 redoxin domain-containing protein [Sphingobacterium sp. dk4302]
MKKVSLYTAYTLFLLLFCMQVADSQTISMSNTASNKPQSLRDELNILINQNTNEAKEQLNAKVAILAKSNKEDELMLARGVYKTIEDEVKLKAIEAQILKKFPKGQLARDYAFEDKIGSSIDQLNAKELDKRFKAWKKQFPKESFEIAQQGRQDFLAMLLVKRFAKLGEKDYLDTYLDEMADLNWKTVAYFDAGKQMFDGNDFQAANAYLEKALSLSKQAKSSDSAALQKGFAAMMYNNIVNLLAKNQLQLGNPKLAVDLIQPILEENNYKMFQGDSLVNTLANSYLKQGTPFLGFIAMDKYLQVNSLDNGSVLLAKQLYTAVNNGEDGFDSYISFLKTRKQADLREELSKKLIDKPMEDFTLRDISGKSVSLADYKGKVLVIDFWATWCVPCIKSFPGMQATIEKYKDNSNVAFLFANVWEKGADFKNKATKLMQDKGYDFKVVFDENQEGNSLLVERLGIKSIPTKVFVDAQGKIRFIASGSETDKESVVAEVSSIIDLIK